MAKNAINPSTGKRYGGRPRDDWGYDDDAGEYYVYGSSYDPGDASFGLHDYDSSDGAGPIDAGTETASRTSIFEATQDRIGVEIPTSKPKTTRAPRGSKKTGLITTAHVETWITLGFSMIAMYRNLDVWKIQNPEIELRPWTPSAAELLSKIPAEYAEKITAGSAAVTVAMGVTSLVTARLMAEQRIRMEYARSQREDMQKKEGVPVTNRPTSGTIQGPSVSDANIASNGRAGLASPVAPEAPIFGNGF